MSLIVEQRFGPQLEMIENVVSDRTKVIAEGFKKKFDELISTVREQKKIIEQQRKTSQTPEPKPVPDEEIKEQPLSSKKEEKPKKKSKRPKKSKQEKSQER